MAISWAMASPCFRLLSLSDWTSKTLLQRSDRVFHGRGDAAAARQLQNIGQFVMIPAVSGKRRLDRRADGIERRARAAADRVVLAAVGHQRERLRRQQHLDRDDLLDVLDDGAGFPRAPGGV